MTPSSPAPVFDGHNDLLLKLWLEHADDPVGAFYTRVENGHLDFPRMRRGGFCGGLFAVFIPPVSYIAQVRNQSEAQAQAAFDPVAITEAQIAILYRLEQASQGQLRICRTVNEIEQCRRNRQIAAVLHIEGAGALDAGLTRLDHFYALGVRSIGPFWNLPNAFGEGVNGPFPGTPDTGAGMTPAGLALIAACNRRRIMIDVSHMNEKAFWQTAELSRAPLVATHSNAHALCPQPRNLTDAQLAAIAQSDGFVGVNFGTAFLRADGKRDSATTPLTEIVKHIEYLIARLGEDRVGFGSDFDGVNVPAPLGDVGGLPLLMQALSQAGFEEPLLEKLAWRNWRRTLAASWGE
ncbi:dipeptidase [Serratia entomophila]|uniref:dipeptidase n=1 Tax=Serratia entomophila TaxID=42906 RepID=UPI00217A14E6|nr:dipeptidase [Serratia entomophila]CAI0779846.1 Predicted O-methyltransferase [Serratia entomophila]CAI0800008.1 Predicted O-methyltransferase [Serratia entomophila]CAI0800514.1 Predicted O-methyltransferase [Serratia entomophila]CAI1593073.1 Predicted O-methyltransferase [Serratia entomophila]CAI1646720.1 Predicted O-methyltransferase [Serratia entomophila]